MGFTVEYANEYTIMDELKRDPSVWSIAEAMTLIEAAKGEVMYREGCYDWNAREFTRAGWLTIREEVVFA